MIRPPLYCLAFLGGLSPWDGQLNAYNAQNRIKDLLNSSVPQHNHSSVALYYVKDGNYSDEHGFPDTLPGFQDTTLVTIHDKRRNYCKCAAIASPNSVFREPLPGEAITLPNPSAATGEYLLDRDLFTKVAELRTFIEDFEVSRGKRSQLRRLEREMNKEGAEIVQLTAEEAAQIEERKDEYTDESDDEPITPIDINEKTLEPIYDHLYEENMLEEVLGKAFSVYRKDRDYASVQRLEDIAGEMAPVAEKVRKGRSEEIIVRLINCYLDDKEDINDVLEELQKKKQLNKYLMQRLDELIKLAAQKFRVSDKHPAVSEHFLTTLKDRVAAQMITSARGTDRWVKILADCFRYDNCVDYEAVLKKHLRKIEDIEDFRDWLLDGISYCRKKGRMENQLEAMENIESIVVSLHPVWTPTDDHVETEAKAYDHPLMIEDVLSEQ
ncbi:uncharacterized protein BXIN_1353 [Babesia sp. Xinjiang]|uniref:uncharacterized protein n=1 Tax=Babesia sp. Xinjiang TaxID=462227 RepID=UPI000A23343E|nr:uncharacterized protein BXIN_1353 [Babesia sp. Xinjiang]ORM39918.1 hypothetical protein BXIN_1353 [Babesia sp. Xinjiang]